MTHALIAPATVLLLVTFLVWLLMLIRRVSETKSKRIHPQKLATPEGVQEHLSDRALAVSNCFRNMLEVPMVFYITCTFVTLTNQVDSTYLSMAWAFVGLRAVQAVVHSTYNRVMHRFIAYLLGSIIAWAMVIRFGLSVL